MSPSPEPATSPTTPSWQIRAQCWGAGLLFALALIASLSSTLRNLDTGYLAGHEFRQAQTALSIHFIARDSDYSLAYPTPVFGPPWSIPMEFPLYQWIVAGTLQAQENGSLESTARTVSLLGFYLCLPAVFLLLRSAGAGISTALLGLTLVLSSPIYVFYSRAILIESLALCLSTWFLVAVTRLIARPHLLWCLLTAVLGTGAALVKVTTFAIWGGLALIIGTFATLRLWRRGEQRAAIRLLILLAGAALPPLVGGWLWVQWSDTVKAMSPGGFFLTSDSLLSFNLGTRTQRLDPELWQELLLHAHRGIIPAGGWIVLGLLLLWPGPARAPRAVLLLLGATALTWLSFPELYRIHDYYLYAMGILPLASLALTTQRWAGSARWWWLPTIATLVVSGLQWDQHRRHYNDLQLVPGNGGDTLHHLLRDATHPDEVILAVGSDWSSSVSLYTLRRTLMFKYGVHSSPEIREQMIQSLEGLEVSGLLVMQYSEGMEDTIAELINRFQLDPEPTFTQNQTSFHARLAQRGPLRAHYQSYVDHFHGVQATGQAMITQNTDPIIADQTIQNVSQNQAQSTFALFSPAPVRYRTQYAFEHQPEGPEVTMLAHPSSDIWLEWGQPTAQFEIQFGIYHQAYQTPGQNSDGVWFRVHGESPDGEETLLWERYLDPFNQPSDRGSLSHRFNAPAGTWQTFRLSTRPGPKTAFDAAFWGNVTVAP